MTNNKKDNNNNKEARPQEKLSDFERRHQILQMFKDDNLPDPLTHWEEWSQENKNLMKIADLVQYNISETLAKNRKIRRDNADLLRKTGVITETVESERPLSNPTSQVLNQNMDTEISTGQVPEESEILNTPSRMTTRSKTKEKTAKEQAKKKLKDKGNGNKRNPSLGQIMSEQVAQGNPVTEKKGNSEEKITETPLINTSENPPVQDLTSNQSNTEEPEIIPYTRETTPHDLQQYSRDPPVQPTERVLMNRPNQRDFDIRQMTYEQYKDYRHAFMYPRLYYPHGFPIIERWIREYTLQLDMKELAIRKYQDIVKEINEQRAVVLLDKKISKVEAECLLRAQQHTLNMHHQDKIVLELDVLRRLDELRRYRDMKIAKKQWELDGKLPRELKYDNLKKRTLSITDEFENKVIELDEKLRGEVVNAGDPSLDENPYRRERRLSREQHEERVKQAAQDNAFHAHLRYRAMTPEQKDMINALEKNEIAARYSQNLKNSDNRATQEIMNNLEQERQRDPNYRHLQEMASTQESMGGAVKRMNERLTNVQQELQGLGNLKNSVNSLLTLTETVEDLRYNVETLKREIRRTQSQPPRHVDREYEDRYSRSSQAPYDSRDNPEFEGLPPDEPEVRGRSTSRREYRRDNYDRDYYDYRQDDRQRGRSHSTTSSCPTCLPVLIEREKIKKQRNEYYELRNQRKQREKESQSIHSGSQSRYRHSDYMASPIYTQEPLAQVNPATQQIAQPQQVTPLPQEKKGRIHGDCTVLESDTNVPIIMEWLRKFKKLRDENPHVEVKPENYIHSAVQMTIKAQGYEGREMIWAEQKIAKRQEFLESTALDHIDNRLKDWPLSQGDVQQQFEIFWKNAFDATKHIQFNASDTTRIKERKVFTKIWERIPYIFTISKENLEEKILMGEVTSIGDMRKLFENKLSVAMDIMRDYELQGLKPSLGRDLHKSTKTVTAEGVNLIHPAPVQTPAPDYSQFYALMGHNRGNQRDRSRAAQRSSAPYDPSKKTNTPKVNQCFPLNDRQYFILRPKCPSCGLFGHAGIVCQKRNERCQCCGGMGHTYKFCPYYADSYDFVGGSVRKVWPTISQAKDNRFKKIKVPVNLQNPQCLRDQLAVEDIGITLSRGLNTQVNQNLVIHTTPMANAHGDFMSGRKRIQQISGNQPHRQTTIPRLENAYPTTQQLNVHPVQMHKIRHTVNRSGLFDGRGNRVPPKTTEVMLDNGETKNMNSLLDSGADVNVVPQHLVADLHLEGLEIPGEAARHEIVLSDNVTVLPVDKIINATFTIFGINDAQRQAKNQWLYIITSNSWKELIIGRQTLQVAGLLDPNFFISLK